MSAQTPDTAAVLQVLVNKGLGEPCSPEWMRRMLNPVPLPGCPLYPPKWPSIRLNAALGKLAKLGWAKRYGYNRYEPRWLSTHAGLAALRKWEAER